ncbi:hypothetical protein Tco_0246885 [Tanacetum coccineum]
MSTPKFAKTHNLVAFLDKPEESEGFEQIINFLNPSSIRYALTVNPTNYTSCIKQLWATAKVQTINEEVQIQALVYEKKVIITKTSVRRALYLKDAKGTDCLPTATIFAELERMGAKTTVWNEFSSTMASAIICLATNQIFNFSKYIFNNMVKNLESGVKFLMYPRRKQRKDSSPTKPIPDEDTNEEHVSTLSYDLSQSGEDRLQLTELMSLCTSLQEKVLDLEEAKTSQAKEIASLKKRVKQLEKRRKSRTLRLKRLRKGRKIANLDVDEEVTLIDETQERNDEEMLFDVQDDLQGEEVVAEKEVTEKKAKEKGKAKMVEPEKPLKKKDQIAIDEEVARNLEAQLQVKLEEEERLSRQKEEEANIALTESWDNTQAMMDADF